MQPVYDVYNLIWAIKMWCTFIIARIALWVYIGVIALNLYNCQMNPSNLLSMFRDSIWCINLIMHTYCALHRCHDDCCFSLSGVHSLLSVEREPEVKINNASWRILVLNRQVKNLFLKQYSGFLNQASITSYLPIYVLRCFRIS